jgi:hypothetical protein
MGNFIEIYEKAVPKKICEYFITFFEKQDKLGNTWSGTMGGGHVKEEWKHCTDLNIRRDENIEEYKAFDNPKHLKMLDAYEKIVDKKFAAYFRKYDSGLGVKIDSMKFYSCKDVDSGPLMHRYEPPEEGFHVWHADWGPWGGSATHRMVIGMLYLNDVAKGGETEFLHQKVAIKPRQGTIVVWPAYFTHTHRGNAPVSGRKYIVNKWGFPVKL